MSNIYFPICAVFISVLVNLIYFSKKRVKNKETNTYVFLSVICLIESALACIILALALQFGTPSIIQVLNRIDYILIIWWISLFFDYIYYVLNKKESKFIKKLIFILNTIGIIVTIVSPMTLINENGIMDAAGLSPSIVFGIVGIYIAMSIFLLVKSTIQNRHSLRNRKLVPLYTLIILALGMMAIRFFLPGLTLLSFIISYVCLIMYFTIENPDLQMIQELELAKQQAEKANNAKTEFLSSMSHEIRTPLNAIVGFSQALSEEDIPDSAKEEVKDIMMASENLLEIVNGILDISKIEANKLEIVNTEYNLSKILNELVSLTKARLGEKPIDFRVDFDSDLPDFLYGDYMRIKQIILNLLTNAVKYTKSGHIGFHVSCIKKENVCRLIISVEDTGIGIQPEKIDKLFTKFERFDLENNITIEGTGLGLAITKKLIDLMSGQIVVQSVYGKGSKFTVALDQRIVLEPTISIEKETKTKSLEHYPNLSKFKVLVVDDNKVNLKVASRLLRDYKLNITEVGSGYECVEKIRAGERYHLILLDDMMPKMSGVETLQFLKLDKSFDTPVVALTANAISGMREKYLKDGFHDYLSKPIDREELNRVIEKFLIQKR